MAENEIEKTILKIEELTLNLEKEQGQLRANIYSTNGLFETEEKREAFKKTYQEKVIQPIQDALSKAKENLDELLS